MQFVWPHRASRNRILRRTIAIWLVIRTTLLVFSVLLRESPLITMPLQVTLLVIALVGGLTWLDARRHNESFFLASLGVHTSTVHMLAFAPPLLLELLVWLAPLL